MSFWRILWHLKAGPSIRKHNCHESTIAGDSEINLVAPVLFSGHLGSTDPRGSRHYASVIGRFYSLRSMPWFQLVLDTTLRFTSRGRFFLKHVSPSTTVPTGRADTAFRATAQSRPVSPSLHLLPCFAHLGALLPLVGSARHTFDVPYARGLCRHSRGACSDSMSLERSLRRAW